MTEQVLLGYQRTPRSKAWRRQARRGAVAVAAGKATHELRRDLYWLRDGSFVTAEQAHWGQRR